MSNTPRVFPAIPVPLEDDVDPASIRRADILVRGLEHGGPSYELRVYLNNPQASAASEASPSEGYAGSIYVYGYGRRPPSSEGSNLTSDRYVVASDAIRSALGRGKNLGVTLVPVAFGAAEPDVDLSKAQVSVVLRD